jgi:hypothetical protein
MKKLLNSFLIIGCLCIIYSPLFANDSYTNVSGFSVILKNGEVNQVQPIDDNKVSIFVGDENGNSSIEKILFDNGSEILVEFDKDGKFRVKINELDIEILSNLNDSDVMIEMVDSPLSFKDLP